MLSRRYRLLEPLASGGMGTVWRAVDLLLDRPVAIKEVRLPPGLDDEARTMLRRRTMREAQAAARLRHAAIVTVYDVVEQDDRPWIVMELVHSRSLAQVIREDGPLPPVRVASIGLRILGAMETAYAGGVQHRDIKPANVLITDEGRVVLTDFGIARHTGDETLTSAGLLLGSPDYLAPERARGRPSPGLAADLWSLGALMYDAVEGRRPFERDGPLPTLAAVVMDEPDPPVRAGPLRPVIDGLLIKDPAHRLDAERTRSMLERIVRGRSAGGTMPLRSAPGAGTERRGPRGPVPASEGRVPPGPVPGSEVAAGPRATGQPPAAAPPAGDTSVEPRVAPPAPDRSGSADPAPSESRPTDPAQAASAALPTGAADDAPPPPEARPIGSAPATPEPAEVAPAQSKARTGPAEVPPTPPESRGADAARDRTPEPHRTTRAATAAAAAAVAAAAAASARTRTGPEPDAAAEPHRTEAGAAASALPRTEPGPRADPDPRHTEPAGAAAGMSAPPRIEPAAPSAPPRTDPGPATEPDRIEPAAATSALPRTAPDPEFPPTRPGRVPPGPPAERPDRDGDGSRRRPAVLAALALAALAVLAAVVVPRVRSEDPGGRAAPPPAGTATATASAPAGTGAAPSATTPPTTAPSSSPAGRSAGPTPAAAPTGAAVAAPAGFIRFTDPQHGFSLVVPAGWRPIRRDTRVDFDDPASSRFLRIDTSSRPKADPYQNWIDYERSYRQGKTDYRNLGIRRVPDYRVGSGWTTADWEFMIGNTHVLDRNIRVSDSRAHAIYWSTPESRWDSADSRRIFDLAAASFVPAPVAGPASDGG
ncbi:MAG TPA: protein kinase [Mycobacteriales bacterium]